VAQAVNPYSSAPVTRNRLWRRWDGGMSKPCNSSHAVCSLQEQVSQSPDGHNVNGGSGRWGIPHKTNLAGYGMPLLFRRWMTALFPSRRPCFRFRVSFNAPVKGVKFASYPAPRAAQRFEQIRARIRPPILSISEGSASSGSTQTVAPGCRQRFP
jgi:hypothetical protein